ncbi:MAG: diguanylate cyclase [Syntrophomonadaceae bacterium]|nr:diguanylate cyclase [Syntrophomonadaceae bacterium]
METDIKQTILIVDDERLSSAVLNNILSPEYSILMARSGGAALKTAEEAVPDLIVLDIIMPDMNGFDVLKNLKNNVVTSKIPVIFITGLKKVQDEETGFLLGAVDYITKPFVATIVKARVNTHTQIARQMRMIENLGMIDPLTNIPNRRNFDERLDLEWKRAIRDKRPVSFLMIDLDNFKQFNDTHGHLRGDALLKAVSKAFTSCIKRPADLAARLGGEEFGIILPDTDLNGAMKVAEDIRAAVEAVRIPAAYDKQNKLSTTVSIGAVTWYPQIKDSALELIAKADKYMYIAKKTGKNRVYTELPENSGR